ncbi:MAG: UvrD-helicase domain-containing protein, partial [Candidatus Omnitrophica bacterium]|nr:UvrD-helicase domain-containing protein [Candidatus Omnitrophota bacterium]
IRDRPLKRGLSLILMLKELNQPQREAVTYTGGALLVLAGAGSGKTRVLTTRIAYLIDQGVSSRHILAVTFTNKSAQEMKHRVNRLIGSYAHIGTFHSIGLGILRQHAERVKRKKDFTILDDQDQTALVKDILKDLNIDQKILTPKRIVERISRFKDDLLQPEDISINDRLDEIVVQVYDEYERRLKISNAFDFGDLIAHVVRIFESQADVLKTYQTKYQHILVDEYQDTNTAQYRLIKILAANTQNITVVGDPDQTIYEWRGANVENILRFEKDFKDVKVIRLEQNYRSTNRILQAANAIIANNVQRKDKTLWSDKGEGERIELYCAYDEREEARYLTSEIFRLRQKNISLNQMVGFYRTHSQSRVIEEELLRQNIPYKIIGGVKFYARKEIKDLLGYLHVIHNPENEVNLWRIINTPKRGIGLTTVAKVKQYAYSHEIPFFEALQKICETKDVTKGVKSKLTGFHQLIQGFRDKLEQLNLPELLEHVVEETGYVQILEDENTLEAKGRMENIREFYQSLAEFHQALPDDSPADQLRLYLEYISLQTSIDEWKEEESYFTLMTLHSAKGLEFPYVFMLGMEEEILPHANAVNGDMKELEEERRLCYVGFTRAMTQLYLTYAQIRHMYGTTHRQTPSRFLFEIPAALLTRDVEVHRGFDDYRQSRPTNHIIADDDYGFNESDDYDDDVYIMTE